MFMQQNITALVTIVRKEIDRIMRIWTQTLLPPVVTQSLYFIVFGGFVGSQVRAIDGISYMAFIVPGLIMMTVVTNAFSNVASSFFGSKFQKSIEELLVAPVPNWVIIAGYVLGGVFRALVVGLIVFGVSCFFVQPSIQHPFFMLLFALLTAISFSLAGLANGILAKRFDDVAIFPTFVLTPLTYLGGVFYSVKNLPPLWQSVSQLNPILYMVNGFRYGFYNITDVNIWGSFVILTVLIVFLMSLNFYLLRRGYGLKN
jgi:ABC-2 type transport system permease protein